MDIEVVLSLAYAIFLTVLAFSLECLARKSHKRAEDYRNAGFVYFKELDYFECPAGHQLVRLETDHNRRVTSYRAPASACNSCSLKLNCTDSEDGRLVEKRLDAWIGSAVRCFHRGISLTLLFLATVLLVAESVRHSQPQDRRALTSLLLLLGIVQLTLLRSLWRPRHIP